MNVERPVARYAVDLALCVDCTSSMSPFLGFLEDIVTHFHASFEEEMNRNSKDLAALRVRLVVFGDLGEDDEVAINASAFFELPNQSTELERYVSTLVASGGGRDKPRSSLEALVTAIRSPWTAGPGPVRHTVMMCTDGPAHALGKFPVEVSGQSRPIPTSLAGLQAIWGDEIDDGEMVYSAKRLIVVGPDTYPWNELAESLENAIWVMTASGEGLREVDEDLLFRSICGSV